MARRMEAVTLSSRAQQVSSRAQRGIGTFVFLTALACSRGVAVGSSQAGPDQAPAINTLSAREQRDGWKLLFDGQSITKNWRAYKADTVGPAWTIVNGVLTKTRPGDDIVTREKFRDFEFAWDWKVSPRGNSGG